MKIARVQVLETPLPGVPDAEVDLSRADITLRTVSLKYPGRGRPVLDDVGLTVRPGEHIVLTGPSGAGKSSRLALLLRFATPASGTITAGNADLAQIAWVPQHPHLFATSVAGNIALGHPRTPRPDIVAAARLAGAGDFIRRLPRGYDTVLTEGARPAPTTVVACLLVLAPAGAVLTAGLRVAGIGVPFLATRVARGPARRIAPARGRLAATFTDLLAGAADLHAFGAQETGSTSTCHRDAGAP